MIYGMNTGFHAIDVKYVGMNDKFNFRRYSVLKIK